VSHITDPGSLPLLVGRERELAMLRQHLDAAIGGHGSLVLIGGEAGIGKTALAEWLCREAAEQGALVLVGRCYDLTETPPYGPWVELFGRYRPEQGMPLLPDAFTQRDTVGAVMSQAALFQQVLDFFAALAAARALVLLLDDLHWSDPASLDLLRVLARSLAPLPLLLVATYRREEVSRHHPLAPLLPLLVREANADRLDLHPLDDSAVRSLIHNRHRLPHADAERLLAYLQTRAQGNALFVGELLRDLVEGGVLRPAGDEWTLGDVKMAMVPALVRQVIDARVARLDAESQRLLALAAVIGQEVPLGVWAVVGGVAEERLLAVVARAEAAHLVVEERDGTAVRFVHALVREALYEGTRPTQRRRWHRLVGEALAALPNPDTDAVAAHFQRAGDARAAEWLIRAGEGAQRGYAYVTAAERYEAALALLGREAAATGTCGWLRYRLGALLRVIDIRRSLAHLDEAARIAVVVDDATLAAAIRFMRAFCGGFAGEVGVLEEMASAVDALEALPRVEHARLNAQDGVDEAATDKPWRGSLVFYLALRGRFAEAVTMGEPFVAALPSQVAPGGLRAFTYGGAPVGLGFAYAHLGRPVEARRAFARARAIFRERGDHGNLATSTDLQLIWVFLPYDADKRAEYQALADEAERSWERVYATFPDGFDPAIVQVPLLLVAGEWERARALLDPVRHFLAKPMRERAQHRLGLLARWQGEAELAWALVRETLPGGPSASPESVWFYETLATMQPLAAGLALDAGHTDTARTWLGARDRSLAYSGALLGHAERDLLWARYHWAVGDAEGAREHAERALVRATEPRQTLALVAAQRLLGALATEAGRYAEAQTFLEHALRIGDSIAAPFERALTLLALAELQAATGEHDTAMVTLGVVRSLCTPLGAQPTLARADALAARLTATPDTPPVYPAGLSVREVEVLRLLALGRTNREIGETLFLSERTIDAHVRNILTKTNMDNRAAAARWAAEHRLA
jgi:DNA-binding CsgD family transcriptional regulator/tetratricopeptide (TPR) repeat protein